MFSSPYSLSIQAFESLGSPESPSPSPALLCSSLSSSLRHLQLAVEAADAPVPPPPQRVVEDGQQEAHVQVQLLRVQYATFDGAAALQRFAHSEPRIHVLDLLERGEHQHHMHSLGQVGGQRELSFHFDFHVFLLLLILRGS